MAPVNQYSAMPASIWSRVSARCGSPPQSVQVRNFSSSHAAKPAGLSVSAKASVCGLVPWIHW